MVWSSKTLFYFSHAIILYLRRPHTVATGQISVIFRVLKIWVWKTYLTKVIEYNLILYTILEVARFLRIVYKSSHKKLFSISNNNFKHRCRITWNWQLFNHFCLPHFGLRQITNTLEMTHWVSQCTLCGRSLRWRNILTSITIYNLDSVSWSRELELYLHCLIKTVSKAKCEDINF